jgi:DNA-directed RNA polymerase subunit RPC12/RpoP
MKTKQILMAGALALSMVLSGGMLTGCSNSSTKDTKTTEVAKKKEVKTLGQKTKDSKSLKFTNSTGKKITVFETKSSSEESFGDNLLDDGDAVKSKEERTLYYTVKENDKLDVKVGLQNQDKTFVFKDVDTTDTKKVDVSLKDDKVNLDVTKKDGTTVTLTPSEDSAKTEEEKKDESEVKQEEKKEEKKEETAKTDSSNKSNTSDSKKDNTASTTNTSSNKNNSSSSKPSNSSNSSNSNNSKPAEHTHNWVAQYKTVNVPEKGHNEQVLVQAAYDEQVPITEMKAYSICSTCGADITGNTSAHVKNHVMIGDDKGGYYTEWRETVVGYNTVHHDAVYETRYVVDSPATTKQELTGYKCSSCGKTKAN